MSRRGAIGLSPTAIGVRYGYRRVYIVLDRICGKVGYPKNEVLAVLEQLVAELDIESDSRGANRRQRPL